MADSLMVFGLKMKILSNNGFNLVYAEVILIVVILIIGLSDINNVFICVNKYYHYSCGTNYSGLV